VEDPFYVTKTQSVRYVPDGMLVVENGIVKAFGAYDRLKEQFSDITAFEYPGMLLMPGFIDIHVHFSQTKMIAA
jgi:guanine deaminase